jgi:hypothetical protein
LEPGLSAFADWAELSGWLEHEVNDTLLRLVVSRILRANAHIDTDEIVRRASRALEGIIRR